MPVEFAADDQRRLEALPDPQPAPSPQPALVGGAGRLLNAPVRLLDLPLPVFAALRKRGIHVLGELCRLTPADLPESLRDTILAALAPHGLRLQGAAAPNPWHLPLLDPLPVSWVQQPVDMLDLTQRSRNTLRSAGITTLGQLGQMTPRDLLKLSHFGQSSLTDLRLAFHQRGLFGPPADELVVGEPVEVLKLTGRALNILLRAGLRTLDQLCAWSEADLSQLPTAGRGTVQEVRKALARSGRSLQDGTPHGPGPGWDGRAPGI